MRLARRYNVSESFGTGLLLATAALARVTGFANP